MAAEILTDLNFLINGQVRMQEEVNCILSKIESAIAVIQRVEAARSMPDYILYNYFSIISDLTEVAMKRNQESLEALLEYNESF